MGSSKGQGGQRSGLRSDLALPQDTESCYLIHALLKFYLNTVFKNYHKKIVEFKILKSFSTLANNFLAIMSKLQPSVSRTELGPGAWETACLRISPPLSWWSWLLVHNKEWGVLQKKSSCSDLGLDLVIFCKMPNLSGFQFCHL
jgi:hypothetical protein